MPVKKAVTSTAEWVAYVIAAQGGWAQWSEVRAFRFRLRARFPILLSKGLAPGWRNLRVRVETGRLAVTLYDYPSQGYCGQFAGRRVRIEAESGCYAQRWMSLDTQGRVHLGWHWDALDFLYFLGYALWNYLHTPFLLQRPEVQSWLLAPRRQAGGAWLHPLQVCFPAWLPTHCREQVFYFDESGLLQRLDYRAEAIGRWAQGAQLCRAHEDIGGLIYPTYREVRATWGAGHVLPFPTAVQASFDDFELEKLSARPAEGGRRMVCRRGMR